MILKNSLRTATFVVLGSLAILSSCNSGSQQNQDASAQADSLKKDSLAKQVKDIVYPLPTPFEMTKMLNNIGAIYVPRALNPINNVDKYFTEKSKAVNLGVYGADVAYTVTYNKPQDTKLYLKTIKRLMDELGVKIDYSYMISDEFKQKLTNKDTVVKVVTNTFFDTYQYLNQKNSPEMAVMMVSGMWVELMYIATHISNDTYDNPEIIKIIANQKESYEKLLGLLAQFNSNADIKDLQTKLEILKPSFDKVPSGLKVDDYKQILKTIEAVRTSFVS
jgi:hypothetical protein